MIGNIAEKRVVKRVPDCKNNPDRARFAGIKTEIACKKISQSAARKQAVGISLTELIGSKRTTFGAIAQLKVQLVGTRIITEHTHGRWQEHDVDVIGRGQHRRQVDAEVGLHG